MNRKIIISTSLIIMFVFTVQIHAEEVWTVLSSNSKAYQKAYQGFSKEFGQTIQPHYLSESNSITSNRTKIIVTFGGKAALSYMDKNYPVIYCLAPGLQIDRHRYNHKIINVRMEPQPGFLLYHMKNLQPDINQLDIIYISDNYTSYIQSLKNKQYETAIKIHAEQLTDTDQLPIVLRQHKKNMRSLWIPPDPQLINSNTFAMLRDFCLANKVVLYAPTAKLVEDGAMASISVEFESVGKSAAIAARSLLLNSEIPDEIMPNEIFIIINKKSLDTIGVPLPVEMIKKADRIIE